MTGSTASIFRWIFTEPMAAHPPVDQMVSWVYTHDLEDTCRFYADMLGLTQVRDEGAARIFQISPSGFIGVCKAIGGRVVEPGGGMITVVSDDVDGWYERLEAAGASLKGKPEKVEAFGIYAFLAKDPNGYLIEFQQFLEDAD